MTSFFWLSDKCSPRKLPITMTNASAKTMCVLTAFALALCQASANEIKVASVNIDKILLHYQAADQELSRLKSARDRYLKERNTRQKKINGFAIELKELQAKIKNKAMPRAERNNLLKQRENLIAEYQTLTGEVRQGDDDQTKITKQKITSATLRILNQCQLSISEYAKTHGYQWVIETSGNTTSRVSPLVYARHTVDITDNILDLLNEGYTP